MAMMRVAEHGSRLLRRGHGAVIGGWVALKIEPQVLARVTAGRPVTIVTGTNGKTTTTRLVAEAIGSQRTVATTRGANIPAGLVSAASRHAEEVVLEVDELYVARVVAATRPRVLVLLNISRDQLDRIVEIRRIAELWRVAIRSADWPMTVVANADDPLVVWAVGDQARVVWIAGGYRWTDDAALCPQCGDVRAITDDGSWSCPCGLDRPLPDWAVDGGRLRGPGCDVLFHPRLPGHINATNAAVAVAVAVARGVGAVAAIDAVQRVDSVAGRYATADVSGHTVRLLLAKNPASWAETLPLLGLGCPVVIGVNSRGPDGYDTSWLWDVAFERLAGRTVIATGDRRWDLAVRLQVAGVVCSVSHDPLHAIATLPSSVETVEMVATYTAFHDLLHRLDVKW